MRREEKENTRSRLEKGKDENRRVQKRREEKSREEKRTEAMIKRREEQRIGERSR